MADVERRYHLEYDEDHGGLIVEPVVTWDELVAEVREHERLAATRHGHRPHRPRRHDAR